MNEKIMDVEIMLPWPDRILWPNSRSHWGAKARRAKIARSTGFGLAREKYSPGNYHGPLHVEFVFYPPSRRAWDQDNCVAALKNYLDGVFQGLGMDDRQVKATATSQGEVMKHGGVKVLIKPLPQ